MVGLSDLKWNMGSWRWTADAPVPRWDLLKRANIWTSTMLKLQNIRVSLRNPLVVAQPTQSGTDLRSFSDLEALRPYSYMAYVDPDKVPPAALELKVAACVWEITPGLPRPMHVLEAIDNGAPCFLFATTNLRLSIEVTSLTNQRPDLVVHNLTTYVRRTQPPPGNYTMAIGAAAVVGIPGSVVNKVCTPSSPQAFFLRTPVDTRKNRARPSKFCVRIRI